MSASMSDDARDVQAALAARSDPAATSSAHLAFARIYDRHSTVVRALCMRSGLGLSDADDAVQETFLRAYRLLHQVTDPDHLRSWLYAIARLVCSERRRAAGRRSKHEHAAARELADMNGTRSDMNVPAAAPEHAEALDKLSAAIDELPDDERLAIHLYYLEPDPVGAANTTLGLSRSGFYKLLARARTRLSTSLGAVAP